MRYIFVHIFLFFPNLYSFQIYFLCCVVSPVSCHEWISLVVEIHTTHTQILAFTEIMKCISPTWSDESEIYRFIYEVDRMCPMISVRACMWIVNICILLYIRLHVSPEKVVDNVRQEYVPRCERTIAHSGTPIAAAVAPQETSGTYSRWTLPKFFVREDITFDFFLFIWRMYIIFIVNSSMYIESSLYSDHFSLLVIFFHIFNFQ